MDVNKMMAAILKQLCCLWETISGMTVTVFGSSFSGAGTTDDPKQINVFANGTGYGGGTGTEADPLVINGGSTPPTPALSAVLTAGNQVLKGQMIQIVGGGTPTGVSQGNITGGGDAQDWLAINYTTLLNLVGPRIQSLSLVDLNGTGSIVRFRPAGSGTSNIVWLDGTTGNQLGSVGRNISTGIMELSSAGVLNLSGQVGTLPTGLTGPIVATDTWIQAIAKLNTLFP